DRGVERAGPGASYGDTRAMPARPRPRVPPAASPDAARGSAVRASQNRVEEDVDAGDGVVELGVFGFVVGDAVAAGREDHDGGGDARDVVGVVAGLAED